MASIHPRGSLVPQSLLSDNTESSVVSNDTELANVELVADTLTHQESYNTDRYNDLVKSLAGYASGSRIVVNYYRLFIDTVGNKATVTDVSGSRSANHSSYEHIKNMTLICQGSFLFNYDPDTTGSTVAGTALVYPGINPRKGDLFTYTLFSEQLGVFQVTSVERLTMDGASYHQIAFQMTEYGAGSPILASLPDQIIKTYYFSDISSSGAILLESGDYINAQTLVRYRQIMINTYFRKYYDTGFATLMPSDGVYDPYVVEYFLRTTSLVETRMRPSQLMPSPKFMDQTLWGRLIEDYDRSVDRLLPSMYVMKLTQSMFGTLMSPLIDNSFLEAVKDPNLESNFTKAILDTRTNYIFSENFYTKNIDAMTAFERMVYYAIVNRNISDICALISIIASVIASDSDDMFYHIPILLYLESLAHSQLTLRL